MITNADFRGAVLSNSRHSGSNKPQIMSPVVKRAACKQALNRELSIAYPPSTGFVRGRERIAIGGLRSPLRPDTSPPQKVSELDACNALSVRIQGALEGGHFWYSDKCPVR